MRIAQPSVEPPPIHTRETATDTRVVMAAPGGAAGGGMTQVVIYLLSALPLSHMFRLEHLPTRSDTTTRLGSFAWLRAALALCIRRLGTRQMILHAHMGERGSVLRKGMLVLLARVLGTPSLLHLHAAELHTLLPKSRSGPAASLHIWFVRMTFRSASRVLVLGERDRRYVVDMLGTQPMRCLVVPNGVPVREAAAYCRGETVGLAFAGNLLPRKGLPDLLDALGSAALRDKPWRLRIAGGGTSAPARRRTEDLQIAHRIEFAGWLDRDALCDLLRDADIVVLPSHHEALPLVLLEAASLGRAIVTTNVGVIGEYFTDGETALLTRAGDIDGLAAALRRLMAEPDLRERLGRNAHALQRRRFDLNEQAAAIADLYRSLRRS